MKPILFNTQMVKAILEGRKTVTRRVIKPQPVGAVHHVTGYKIDYWAEEKATSTGTYLSQMKRPYQPGDILYVRETWAKDPFGPGYIYPTEIPGAGQKWKPSIHMPKDAARIFLKVKSVEAQRLQDFLCCRSEIIKEGISFEGFDTAKKQFAALWESTIKSSERSQYGWEANPWVWVIEFEKENADGAAEN